MRTLQNHITVVTPQRMKGIPAMRTYKLFIGGQWIDSAAGGMFDDVNPFTGEVFAQVAKAGGDDADRALAAALSARKTWASKVPAERAEVLMRAAQLLGERRDSFVNVLTAEGGSTFGKSMFEIVQTVDLLQTAAADSKRIMGETFHTDPRKLSLTIRRPKGTVVAISPWNFPLILSMYKVAYALATGNTVVFKPSSKTPVIGLMIGELFEAAGGLPAGALNIITGPGSEVGAALIKDPRCSFVALTGETATGREVARMAAENLKEFTVELGGKNPLVVLADADMDLAVNAASFGVFIHQGQICMAAGRIIVEQPVVEEFTRRLVEKAKSLPVGDPALPSTVIGPLIDDGQVSKVDDLVQDTVKAGAKLHCGGTFSNRLYQPTVLSGVNRSMRIYHEEVFGPVAPIISVADAQEALDVANDNTYGLAAGVITRDLKKALLFGERIEAGMVHVNNSPVDAESSVPFGGCRGSGMGREGGRYSIEKMTEIKWLTIQKDGAGFPF